MLPGGTTFFSKAPSITYVAMERVGKAHQMLVVGPWYHMPWSRYVGEMDVGEAGKNLVDELQVRFFDRW